MPMPNGGRDVELKRNSSNGLWDLQWDATGNVTHGDSDSHTVLSLLAERLGAWWADRTGVRGSRLHQIKRDTGRAVDETTETARKALELAQEDGRITVESVTAIRASQGKINLKIIYRSQRGTVETTQFTLGY